MSALIYKIASRAQWIAAEASGVFEGAPIDFADGYIHFSDATQAAGTAAKWFAGRDDLMVVAVEADRLGAALKWEPSRGGQLFPHLYGELPLAEVVWAKPLPLGGDGRHVFPDLSA